MIDQLAHKIINLCAAKLKGRGWFTPYPLGAFRLCEGIITIDPHQSIIIIWPRMVIEYDPVSLSEF